MQSAFFSRFRRDRRGAVAVLIAVAIIPLIAMIGTATDSARGYYAKSRLSAAVDAAALAGGQVFFEDRRATDARQFFDANFPPGFMGATLTQWEVDPPAGTKPSPSEHRFTVRASVVIPTTFMKIFGKDTMTVSSYAEVTRESKSLDVVLAIDMSSSMEWDIDGRNPSWGEQSRLELAKAAAKEMVKILYGENETNDLLRVGIVPWAGSVNVTDYNSVWGYGSDGNKLPSAERVLTITPALGLKNQHVHISIPGTGSTVYDTYKSANGGEDQNEVYYLHNSAVPMLAVPEFSTNSSNTWHGCVWARWEPTNDEADNADMENSLTSLWPGWSPMGRDTDHDNHYTKMKYDRVCDWGGKNCRWQWVTTTSSSCAAQSQSPQSGNCVPCPSVGILRLQNSRDTAEDAVEGLTIPSGSGTYSTNIPQGLAWAWRVLSPEEPFTESSLYQEGYEPARAIILLTDGENTEFAGDSYNGDMLGSLSYKMADGTTYTISKRDKRLIDIAKAIKAVKRDNGEPMYEIYTILFAADKSSKMKALMKEVATEPNSPYYYNAPKAEDLTAAFNEIGNHLSNLRLSK